MSGRTVGVDDVASCMEERADLGQCTQYPSEPLISRAKSYLLTNAHQLRQRAIGISAAALHTIWAEAQSKMFMGII